MPKQRNLGKHGRPAYNQAQKIIARFGGESALSEIIGTHRCQIYRWNYAPPYGCNGLIPTKPMTKIRQLARLHGVHLTDADWTPELIKYEDKQP